MRVRVFVSCVCALVVTLTAVTLNGQTPAKSPAAGSAAPPYTPSKTPWGDPDLQAIWSGDSAFGIPLQRPEHVRVRARRPPERWQSRRAS